MTPSEAQPDETRRRQALRRAAREAEQEPARVTPPTPEEKILEDMVLQKMRAGLDRPTAILCANAQIAEDIAQRAPKRI